MKHINSAKEYILRHAIMILFILVVVSTFGFGIKYYFLGSKDYSDYQPLPTDSPSLTVFPTDTPIPTPNETPQTVMDTPTPAPALNLTPSPTPTLTPTTSAPVGVPSQTYSTLTANPTAVRADNSTPMALTVTIKDGNNNPINGATLTLQSNGNQTFTSASLGSNITNGAGQAFFKVVSNTAGTFTVSAFIQYNGGNSTTLPLGSITFSAIPTPDPGHSTVNANPQSVAADGSTASTVTVNLKDNMGNSVPSDTVNITLNSADPNLKINGVSTSSGSINADFNGRVTFNLTSTSTNTTDTFTVTDTTTNVPLNTQLTVTFN